MPWVRSFHGLSHFCRHWFTHAHSHTHTLECIQCCNMHIIYINASLIDRRPQINWRLMEINVERTTWTKWTKKKNRINSAQMFVRWWSTINIYMHRSQQMHKYAHTIYREKITNNLRYVCLVQLMENIYIWLWRVQLMLSSIKNWSTFCHLGDQMR